MKYYSPLKEKEVLQYAVTWEKLEDIMLSEIIQAYKGQFLGNVKWDDYYWFTFEKNYSWIFTQNID